MFTYTPEIRALQADGWYPATIISTRQKHSSAGNPMLVVKVKVTVEGGVSNIVDYLTAGASYRIETFCAAIGHDYASGAIDPDSIPEGGVPCFVRLATEEARGDYGPRNKIVAYKHESDPPPPPEEEKPKRSEPANGDELVDDDIPFSVIPFALPLLSALTWAGTVA